MERPAPCGVSRRKGWGFWPEQLVWRGFSNGIRLLPGNPDTLDGDRCHPVVESAVSSKSP